MKTYQSIAKRFKLTKRGKIVHKSTGLDHFRTKKRGKYILVKRKRKKISPVYKKTILKIMKMK
ncbi:MAG: 50S ribosomal protein L35 [Patescibacteria group bacterium]|nr:50S ribosomal protein L35 [Patescibacteria group bacterium]